jgi:hypothetical protein
MNQVSYNTISGRTSVADLHVDYIRPHYNNAEEWFNTPNNIYVGREGRVNAGGKVFAYKRSLWYNPFKVGTENTLDQALYKYYFYIIEKIQRENLWSELRNLKGKCLGCWCVKTFNEESYANCRCHAQVLLYLIRYYFGE